jgi:galactonate dehydratase
LLGGAHRRRLRVYANGWYTNPGTPEQNADEARRVVAMGYTALKFDPFGQANFYTISAAEAALAEARVAAVRAAVGPAVDILVEAHAKFNVMTAIQLGRRLEAYRPFCYEEPVAEENLSELLQVRQRVNIPIATGERLYTKFPFAQIVEAHAADILQPDVANAGGVTELKKIAIIAEAKHITLAPHNVCSPVGAMAEFQLDASIINFEIQEYHAEFYTPHYFTVCDGFPRQQDGYVTLSDAPGLGLTLNETEIAAHPPLRQVTARGGRRKGSERGEAGVRGSRLVPWNRGQIVSGAPTIVGAWRCHALVQRHGNAGMAAPCPYTTANLARFGIVLRRGEARGRFAGIDGVRQWCG